MTTQKPLDLEPIKAREAAMGPLPETPWGRSALEQAIRDRHILITEVERLRELVEAMCQPCKCNPLYSGEEYCNGGCALQAEVERLRAGLAALIEWDDPVLFHGSLLMTDESKALRPKYTLTQVVHHARALLGKK